MNLNDILRRVRELDEPADARVLWHLLSLNDEKLDALISALERDPNCEQFLSRPKYGSWDFRGPYSTVLHAVKVLCAPGEALDRKLLAAIADWLARDARISVERFYLTNIGR